MLALAVARCVEATSARHTGNKVCHHTCKALPLLSTLGSIHDRRAGHSCSLGSMHVSSRGHIACCDGPLDTALLRLQLASTHVYESH